MNTRSICSKDLHLHSGTNSYVKHTNNCNHAEDESQATAENCRVKEEVRNGEVDGKPDEARWCQHRASSADFYRAQLTQ